MLCIVPEMRMRSYSLYSEDKIGKLKNKLKSENKDKNKNKNKKT